MRSFGICHRPTHVVLNCSQSENTMPPSRNFNVLTRLLVDTFFEHKHFTFKKVKDISTSKIWLRRITVSARTLHRCVLLISCGKMICNAQTFNGTNWTSLWLIPSFYRSILFTWLTVSPIVYTRSRVADLGDRGLSISHVFSSPTRKLFSPHCYPVLKAR